MNEIQASIVALVAQALFNQSTIGYLSSEILCESKLQAVEGLINKRAYAVFVNNTRILHAHAELTSILQGIPFVTMKGYASAYYYPQPIRRTMGDVDFLVHPSDILEA